MTSDPPDRLAPPSASLLKRQASSGEKLAWNRSGPASAAIPGEGVELASGVTVAVGISVGKTMAAVGDGRGVAVGVGDEGGAEAQPLIVTAHASRSVRAKVADGIMQARILPKDLRPDKGRQAPEGARRAGVAGRSAADQGYQAAKSSKVTVSVAELSALAYRPKVPEV